MTKRSAASSIQLTPAVCRPVIGRSIVFLIIGIVGYFTIPTVAGWIIQAGGGIGSYNKNINTAGALGGSVAGAAAGNVAGRAGKLIKGTAGKLFRR